MPQATINQIYLHPIQVNDKIILPKYFYLHEDVVGIARALLGKILETNHNGVITSGRIIETEAYRAPEDRASHAWNNRRTPRTETMFQEGGRAYIYLCYGIHHLFNVVTGPAEIPHAVLIRALIPMEGLEMMQDRRGRPVPVQRLCQGPGSLSQALGIKTQWDGEDLSTGRIRIWEDGFRLEQQHIQCQPRVGVEYAGADALLPWRFVWKPN